MSLLKPKRQLTAKQLEALQKGREKRHESMRTVNKKPINTEKEYNTVCNDIKMLEHDDKVPNPPPALQSIHEVDDFNEEVLTKKQKKQLMELEHQMKLKELELKMNKMEEEYAGPKKEAEEKQNITPSAPQFVFRNVRRPLY